MTEADPRFEELLEYLREARGFDFTGYKRSSLMRRVDRRMRDVGISDYEQYRDRLEVDQGEFTSLFNTILINVTAFFRDPEAWEQLQSDVLPDVLRRRPQGPLRFWSAGCASGQEPYSLAMVLVELLGPAEFRERVKIYATDVDEEALAQARQATYTAGQLEGVSPERIERFFEQSNGGYTVRKELRRSVIFGRNDLVQDAPISRVDVLMCRNTLMYLNADTQSKVLDRLHFALQDDGVLFLGRAEMLLQQADLFTPLDLRRRFFRKAHADRRRNLGYLVGRFGPLDAAADPVAMLRDAAFASGAEAQLVIDGEGFLAMSNHRARTVFGVGPRDIGRPIQDLDVSYRPIELRGYLDQSRHDGKVVRIGDVEWTRLGGETTWFDIEVVPLVDHQGRWFGSSVLFIDVTRYRMLRDELEYANRQLETAYEELQSTNEELETTNEELQSTVEELETTNEELQSTNEELETMNEELQAMNDELHTGNEELRQRSDDLTDSNFFMDAVLTGLRAGVAVLDWQDRIRMWNRRAEDLWGVRSDEAVGQHLLNLDIGLLDGPRRDVVREMLLGQGDDGGRTLRTVNRRGQPLSVHVMVAHVGDDQGQHSKILVMEERPQSQDDGLDTAEEISRGG